MLFEQNNQKAIKFKKNLLLCKLHASNTGYFPIILLLTVKKVKKT